MNMRWVALAALMCACSSDRIVETDEAYFAWDQRRSLCGVGLDDKLGVGMGDIREGIERARDRDEALIFYAHDIGDDLPAERLEQVLQITSDLGVPFLTFPDLHRDPTPRAGVVITFDDAFVDNWHGARDLFAAYDARATFFMTRFWKQTRTRKDKLHELLALGHAIESHGHNHIDGPRYAEELGVQAYVDDEVLPSLDAMREDGFDPSTFAYPYGARTGQLDAAILERVELVRSLSWLFASSALVQDPCPE
ncbi:MAG: polysaccharide deacetylase family protein [Deltaproteobacteria bacterium]|nr:polysaccharide deacetylase family protein [Deltaproteobacteria bacterium]